MPEPALSMQLSDFRSGLGHWLGYGRGETVAWSDAQLDDINNYIDGGYRQFLIPPALPGETRGHKWSFIEPTSTVTTTASTSTVALPVDCVNVLGDMTYDSDTWSCSIRQVNEEMLRKFQQGAGDSTGKPQYFCLRMNTSVGDIGQRGTITFFPTPDAAYTLTFRRTWIPVPMSDSHPWPLGGALHSDTIMQSIRAYAENMRDGMEGIETKRFMVRLAASVALDRDMQPDVIGVNNDYSDNQQADPRYALNNNYVTYNGVHYGV